MKKTIIKFFGLKGSWTWAKKQMLNGKVVRCKHWSGALKLKIDSKENTLLQCTFQRLNQQKQNGTPIWETSNHHLSYEDFIDYEVVVF
jgi:hypothetical protein